MIGNSLMTADKLTHYITNLGNDFVRFRIQKQVMVPFSRFYYYYYYFLFGHVFTLGVSDFLKLQKTSADRLVVSS